MLIAAEVAHLQALNRMPPFYLQACPLSHVQQSSHKLKHALIPFTMAK